ncbi:hypothetical protein HPB48_002519 [Haemaphysalis longicornis]|uniref:Uncharacterized protein n=1 Tax=Haemaphysalis longicornis TaxID=44386 RepID=A0A9J6FWR2_HAELO|nr:hypothetical protein HPB48_002519 [Haemaphysalis longicornis]
MARAPEFFGERRRLVPCPALSSGGHTANALEWTVALRPGDTPMNSSRVGNRLYSTPLHIPFHRLSTQLAVPPTHLRQKGTGKSEIASLFVRLRLLVGRAEIVGGSSGQLFLKTGSTINLTCEIS